MTGTGAFLTEVGTLVNAEHARIDDRKLVDYSLNPKHEEGGDKALVSARVLGYNQANADALRQQILSGVRTTPAQAHRADRHGTRFTVDLLIEGPTGRTAVVRPGWIYEPGERTPRLTTAFIPER